MGYIKDNEFKSARQIITDLIDIVSKNGMLLLNIGPKADGTITDEETAVLLETGEWLRKNGEGIYGTTFWKQFGEGEVNNEAGFFKDYDEKHYTEKDFRFTFKDGFVYAFQMRPDGNDVKIKAFGKHIPHDFLVNSVTLLETGETLPFGRTEDGMKIITNGLKSVDGYASFGGCPNLSTIVFGPDFEYAGRRAFGDNSGIKVDQHIYFNNFPSRGFDSSVFDGGKRHAVTLHMEWSAKDDWDAWMSTNTVFVTDPPASPYAKGDLEKGSWTDWSMRVWLMWWHPPIASVGGTEYTSLRAAMAAAAGAAIELLAPCVADFTDERVSLDKNEALVVVNDDGHVLGYEPGVPDAPGWKLAVSRQTRGETPVVVYKAVGPAMVILFK